MTQVLRLISELRSSAAVRANVRIMAVDSVLFLGVGSIALAVRAALPNATAYGTTRREPDARFAAITPLALTDTDAIVSAARGARVVVSFPPDGHTDAELAPRLAGATRIAYLSSTAVYSLAADHVTEETPPEPHDERGRARLHAEALWQKSGASVVRLPAFYGPDSGLHLSLARGTFRMPAQTEHLVSRVHVTDAAEFVVAALSAPPRSLLLAGDDEPATVAAVTHFVSELFGLARAVPAASPAEVPASLRGHRRVDSRATRSRFAIELSYPNYRVGYRAIHAALTG